MKYALISEEQIKQLQDALKFSSHGAVKVLESLKPSDPVAWCSISSDGHVQYFDGKPMIMVGKIGNDCHTTALYGLDEVRK